MMNNPSNSKNTGMIVLGSIITLIVGFTLWRGQTAPANNGITFHEAGTTSALTPTPASADPAPQSGSPPPATTTNAPVAPSTPTPAADLIIHVTGAVKKPGVYHLPPNSRCDDALKAAGGANSDANTDALNLASHLEDGSQIHVPTRKEQPARDAQNADALIKHDTPAAPKTEPKISAASTPRTSHSSSSHSGHSGKLTAGSSETVNINTADSTALQKLTGIGPAMAGRIMEYRKTNGGFKSPDELMQVSGIGPKKYAKMEPFVRVK